MSKWSDDHGGVIALITRTDGQTDRRTLICHPLLGSIFSLAPNNKSLSVCPSVRLSGPVPPHRGLLVQGPVPDCVFTTGGGVDRADRADSTFLSLVSLNFVFSHQLQISVRLSALPTPRGNLAAPGSGSTNRLDRLLELPDSARGHLAISSTQPVQSAPPPWSSAQEPLRPLSPPAS
jgi:hypothetical protein